MAPFPRFDQSLTDGVVSLRASAERDIPEVLIAYQDDPRLHLELGEQKPPSGAQLGQRAERFDADRSNGSGLVLAITRPAADTCIGEIRVSDVDWDRGRARLCVWTAPHARGAGLAHRAVELCQRWLRDQCGLEGGC